MELSQFEGEMISVIYKHNDYAKDTLVKAYKELKSFDGVLMVLRIMKETGMPMYRAVQIVKG